MTGSSWTYGSLSAWLRNHVLVASFLILLCSAGPRVFLTWRTDPADLMNSISDAGTYFAPAQSLIERGAFLNSSGKPDVARTPGYPVFFATTLLLAGRDLRMALVAQAVVLSSSVLVLYLLARCILPPVMAFTGCLLAAFSPWGAVLAGLPLSDGTFLLLLVLIFFAMKLIEEVRNPATVILGGACIGLLTGATVLVRPVWPLIVLVAMALFLRCKSTKQGSWLLLVTILVCAQIPVSLWQQRNQREASFNGLSNISGVTVWRYLASRVKAEVDGQDRFTVAAAAMQEEQNWGLSVQEADEERWRRAKVVLREHPVLTFYCFIRSAAEHTIHPSPFVLTWARLNFSGDFLILTLLWGGSLTLAYLGWRCSPDSDWDDGVIDRGWLRIILLICLFLTLSSGISFGQGSRLRAPLELIVPLLAAVGLVRTARAFHQVSISQTQDSSVQSLSDRISRRL